MFIPLSKSSRLLVDPKKIVKLCHVQKTWHHAKGLKTIRKVVIWRVHFAWLLWLDRTLAEVNDYITKYPHPPRSKKEIFDYMWGTSYVGPNPRELGMKVNLKSVFLQKYFRLRKIKFKAELVEIAQRLLLNCKLEYCPSFNPKTAMGIEVA